MKKYGVYELSQLFDKIDVLLQNYFGKEDDYDFLQKENDNRKIDLTNKSYLMFLSNGDVKKIKITKASLPHLLGIKTDYLKSTGLYNSKSSYEIMLEFLRSPQMAIKRSEDGVIDLYKALSPYIEKKVDSLVDNLCINTNYCEMVCKYDKEKTYGFSGEFDNMSYLVLQKKNDKYYVLKLAESQEQKDYYYPMSNQVFDTYEELQDSLSSYLFNQEITLLNALRIYNNNVLGGSYYIKEWDRKNKVENLCKYSKDLGCVPNVIADYIYSLKLRDDKRKTNINDSDAMEMLCNCMKDKVPFDLEKKWVESEELIQIINSYNNSLFENVGIDTEKTYSDLTNTNKSLLENIKSLEKENNQLKSELETIGSKLENTECMYKDAEEKIAKIKGILN